MTPEQDRGTEEVLSVVRGDPKAARVRLMGRILLDAGLIALVGMLFTLVLRNP